MGTGSRSWDLNTGRLWAERHLFTDIAAAVQRRGLVRFVRCRRLRTLGLPPIRALYLQALSGGATTRGPTDGPEWRSIGWVLRAAFHGGVRQHSYPQLPHPRAGTARPTESNANVWSPPDHEWHPLVWSPRLTEVRNKHCVCSLNRRAPLHYTSGSSRCLQLTGAAGAWGRPRVGLSSMQAGQYSTRPGAWPSKGGAPTGARPSFCPLAQERPRERFQIGFSWKPPRNGCGAEGCRDPSCFFSCQP